MKQELQREKKKEREKILSVMEDLSVVIALLILLLALIFLMDIARYQWILMAVLLLGFLMNLNIMFCGIVRKNNVAGAVAGLMTLGLVGCFAYLARQLI